MQEWITLFLVRKSFSFYRYMIEIRRRQLFGNKPNQRV